MPELCALCALCPLCALMSDLCALITGVAVGDILSMCRMMGDVLGLGMAGRPNEGDLSMFFFPLPTEADL